MARSSLSLLFLFLGCSGTRHAYPEPGPEDAPADAPFVAPDVATDAAADVLVPPADVEDVAEDVAEDADDAFVEIPDTGPAQPPPELRKCELRFTYEAVGETIGALSLPGEFDAWDTSAVPFSDADGNGTWEAVLDTSALAPGSYGYKLYKDGQWMLDPGQPMRKSVGDVENSKAIVPDCRAPLLEVETLEVGEASVKAVVQVHDGAGSTGLLQGSAKVRHNFEDLDGTYDAAEQRFHVTLSGLAPGKHTLRFHINNEHGGSEPLVLPVWVGAPAAFKWSDAVLYFAMVDRFADGDPATGSPASCLPEGNKANWLGGDLAGITKKLEEGYFTDLGVNALWLTSVVDNPDGCLAGLLGKQYTSYHGYFPSSQTEVEGHIGTMDDLRALVTAAHGRGIRVLVDLVANHLYEQHPYVTEHADWFNAYTPCKENDGFNKFPLTCWFESYLPDLNYSNDAPVTAMTDMAVAWARDADLDGFRVDAVKHMHVNFLLTLRHELTRALGSSFYLVGETYMGDWGGGSGESETTIKKYVGPTLLDGQFDFPLYWRILRVVGRGEAAPLSLADYLTQSEGYYGPGAIMGTFLGNHDVPRFASHANGDIGDVWGNGAQQQGWDAPPGAPSSATAYQKLALAYSLLFTIRGVPLIYYGDEIGMPGAGDPDNRRMMTFTGWSAEQQALHDRVAALAKARATLPSLRTGAYDTISADGSLFTFRRSGPSGAVLVALNVSGSPATATLPASGSLKDALSGQSYDASAGSVSVPLPAWGAAILAP